MHKLLSGCFSHRKVVTALHRLCLRISSKSLDLTKFVTVTIMGRYWQWQKIRTALIGSLTIFVVFFRKTLYTHTNALQFKSGIRSILLFQMKILCVFIMNLKSAFSWNRYLNGAWLISEAGLSELNIRSVTGNAPFVEFFYWAVRRPSDTINLLLSRPFEPDSFLHLTFL